MEGDMSAFEILTGKSIGKIPLGRPRLIWEDNTRTELKEIGFIKRNWVDSAQDRYYWTTLVKMRH